jgi:hypothetical protein
MKINPPSIPLVAGTFPRLREDAGKAQRPKGTAPEKVEVSDAARFVERMREAARNEERARTDEVDRVRAALDAGTYESSVDLDAVVNRLLGDL